MKRIPHRERGIVAMEMAAVVSLGLIGVLAMIVLAGRFTWHAIALTKSVADTNRIVATLPRKKLVADPDVLEEFAVTRISDATRSAGLDLQPLEKYTDVRCGDFKCGDYESPSVLVSAQIQFRDTVFDSAYQDIGLQTFRLFSLSFQAYAQSFPEAPDNKH